MTQQDKDRAAFEKWSNEHEEYTASSYWECLQAWQAARDHYAPKENDEHWMRAWNAAMDYAAEVNALKLTEKEAVERATEAFYSVNDVYDPVAMLAALRAAGMRFKDRA